MKKYDSLEKLMFTVINSPVGVVIERLNDLRESNLEADFIEPVLLFYLTIR
ncbi:MAG: hypothetical protein RIE86_03265 [Imperialibacter sp.]|uniref:hypothetical protein n=1 Tax=Imperialibacter sp. TaxID=2038411 RepID=UPI0032EAACDB